MALTVCAYCDASYLEHLDRCDKCDLSVEQQVWWMRYEGSFFPTWGIFKLKMKIFWKWFLEVIFY